MKVLSNLTKKSSFKDESVSRRRQRVRSAARAKGIWNFVELARRVPCSETAIYMAIEKPGRFGRVWQRIEALCEL
jgi:hypothetical protein